MTRDERFRLAAERTVADNDQPRVVEALAHELVAAQQVAEPFPLLETPDEEDVDVLVPKMPDRRQARPVHGGVHAVGDHTQREVGEVAIEEVPSGLAYSDSPVEAIKVRLQQRSPVVVTNVRFRKRVEGADVGRR